MSPIEGTWVRRGRAMVLTRPPKVSINGTVQNAPVIASGANTITSTGAFGVYAINFAPAVFTTVPVVVVWSGLSSGGSFTNIDLSGVTNLLFQFSIQAFSPGQVVIPNGQTFVVSWIAIGS